MKRVVVTGAGAITPVGMTAEETWASMIAGRSGVSQIEAWDPSGLEVQIAGEVKNFDPRNYMDFKVAKRMDRFAQMAVATAQEAVANAGLVINDANRDRIGVVINTGGGGLPCIEQELTNMFTKGPKYVSPLTIAIFAPNMGSCQISMDLGTHGPSVTSVAACASGILSFIDAFHMIQRDEVDIVITGGTEASIISTAIAGLNNMSALSRRNDDPEGASRPFDSGRDGFVYSEGCALMVLESEESAISRGAHIICEVLGGAMTSDAYHVSAPQPEGKYAGKAMSLAIQRSGLQPADIDYVAAHATATPIGDIAETAAIKQAFGDHAYQLAISANKSMLGHLLGAAGAASGFACVMAIRDGVVPPTTNLTDPDPQCDLDYVPLVARRMTVNAALANGFGFGGQNGVVIFKRYDPSP